MAEEASVNDSAGTGGTSVPQPHPELHNPGRPDGYPLRALRILGWGPAHVRPPAARWAVNILAPAGAVLIIASAIIHLRLWAQGYRGISVIGPLFLAQGVVSIPFAVAIGVFRRLGLMAAGAALMASTAVGLVLSAQVGLFGFKDSLAAPYAGMSLVTEIAAAILLAAGAVLIAAARPSPARRGARRRRAG